MNWFVVPPLDGPPSGGTVYNRLLLAAFRRRRWPSQALALREAPAVLRRAGREDVLWVDSLYLDDFPALAGQAGGDTCVGLILHYLPSLVAHGEAWNPSSLSASESAAITAAHAFCVPSPFVRSVIARLCSPAQVVLLIEPGCEARMPAEPVGPPLRAVMVANLVEGKGVDSFLACLAVQIRPSDPVQVTIVGGSRFDPAYGVRCHALARDPRLRGRVRVRGELTLSEVWNEMAASNLLVSASRMEAYGMALAEARTIGLPILARTGGYVAELVTEASGGRLVAGAAELATACLELARDSAEHRRRIELARAHALPPRPWSAAARDFAAQAASLMLQRRAGAHAASLETQVRDAWGA